VSFIRLPFVARAYRRFPLGRRLFVMVRYILVPWERLVDEVTHPGVVIDIGCGDALFLVLLRERKPDMRGIGIEHDAAKLALGRAHHEGGAFELLSWDQRAAIEALPPADWVMLMDVLYAIPLERWDDVLSFARERLKPGGSIMIKETVNTPRWKWLISHWQEVLATRVLRYTKGDRPHLHAPSFYRQYFDRHGFDCRLSERIDRGYLWSHYLFVATKR
jgi:SAM-dependent methyltransferase